jgi:hypothetical protein
VIPLDTTLVRGSHGRTDLGADRQPILLSSQAMDSLPAQVRCTDVRDIMLDLVFE